MTETVDLLGTTHNTDESIDRVEEVIRDREPDVVGVELPPHVFDDEPEWSVTAALDPREPITVSGLLWKQRMIDGNIWQVDEMFVAARVAADVGAEVALLDRPFAESTDEFARALAGDVLGWLRGLRQEYTEHRDRIDADDRSELVERDVWTVGEWATPYVDYVGMLQRYGVTNFLDADQREAAKKQFGPEGAEASINVIRAWLPRVMETHIDQQDACMAGHLRWLANEEDDVLGIVATGHVPGVAERLNGERELDERILNTAMWAQQKLFGDDSTVDVDELQQLREGHECDMPELSASERSKIMHAVREYFASSWSWQLSDTPVLMLYGENEPFIEAHADYLETRLADCQTMEIPGASHNAQVDNPEFIGARTREFLEEAFDNREQAVRS